MASVLAVVRIGFVPTAIPASHGDEVTFELGEIPRVHGRV
jgi:hypothetical protein